MYMILLNINYLRNILLLASIFAASDMFQYLAMELKAHIYLILFHITSIFPQISGRVPHFLSIQGGNSILQFFVRRHIKKYGPSIRFLEYIKMVPHTDPRTSYGNI